MENLLALVTQAKKAAKPVPLASGGPEAIVLARADKPAAKPAAKRPDPDIPRLRVVSHMGSGADVSGAIMRHLKADLIFVDSMSMAASVVMDRLLLLGGPDLHPWLYGCLKAPRTNCDRDRDSVEWMLIRRAMTENIPIFGICRGHQMINVAYGGSLHQDIQDDMGLYHPNYRTHVVHIKAPLKRHIPKTEVNSYHHQAINTLPIGFQVVAVTDDDIIEGIYRPGVLGVQWHPESLIRTDRRWTRLFRWFVDGALSETWTHERSEFETAAE